MKHSLLVFVVVWAVGASAGQELAVWRDGKVILLDIGTKQERVILEDAAERAIQWTSNGKSLFFWKRIENRYQLWRWDATRNHAHSVTGDFPGGVRNVAISPDGTKLAMMGDQAGGLWLTDVNGRDRVRLTGDGFAEEKPAWSPDGKQIVFADLAMRDDSEADKVRMDRYIIGADGKGKRRLVFSNGSCDSSSWAGSARVVYAGVRNNNSELCLYDLEAQKETNLTSSPEDESHPQTSPDAKHIAFWRRTANGHELWLHDLSAGTQKKITTQRSPDRPQWSANGKWLSWCTEDCVWMWEIGGPAPLNLGKGRVAAWR